MPTNALRDAREAASMTLDDAMHEYRNRMPRPLHISRATVARLEQKDPSRFDAGDLIAAAELAQIYGVKLVDIIPEVADLYASLRRVTHRYASGPSERIPMAGGFVNPCNPQNRPFALSASAA